MCVLGFCVLGLVFGVLGGCLWGVFFVFWRVSGVLFCWGGGFWVDFLFGRCGSICLFCFFGCGGGGSLWACWFCVVCSGVVYGLGGVFVFCCNGVVVGVGYFV